MTTSVKSFMVRDWWLFFVLFGAVVGCNQGVREASQQTLLVSVAASLSDVIDDVAQAFKRETGTHVLANIAGSQVLATQIIGGVETDVFVSADLYQMLRVVDAGRIEGKQIVELLSNQLVIAVPSDRLGSVTNPADLTSASITRIAIGDPEAVPAGVYARQYLEAVGVWAAVAEKIVPVRSVREAIRAVEFGTVDAGVVYRTDVATSVKAVVAYKVELDHGPRIVYPAAMLSDASNPDNAKMFIDYLQGREAQRLFDAAGFVRLLGS